MKRTYLCRFHEIEIGTDKIILTNHLPKIVYIYLKSRSGIKNIFTYIKILIKLFEFSIIFIINE